MKKILNVIICVKAVPESMNIQLDSRTNTVTREGNKQVLNPFDAYAVEAGLEIKDKMNARVTAISMGLKTSEPVLRDVVAMGTDEAVLLNDSAFAGSDTLATSYVLSKGIGHYGPFDLIICGRQSVDSDTAQVGPELAHKLSIPHITCVMSITFKSEKIICCKRVTDFGYEIVETTLPALVTVVKGANEPRKARIRERLRAKNISIPIWNAKLLKIDKMKCGVAGSPTKVVKTYAHDTGNKCCILEGSYEEQAKNLMKRIRQKKTASQPRQQEISNINTKYPLIPSKYKNKSNKEYNGVCLFAGCFNHHLSSAAIELLGTGRRLADSLDAALSVILLGEDLYQSARFLAEHGADIVYISDDPRLKEPLEELAADLICKTILKYKPEIMIFGTTTYERSLAPRVASALETGLTADCTGLSVDKETGLLLQTRPASGGNLMATIICPEKRPQMATVRPNVMLDKIIRQGKPGIIKNEITEITVIPKCKIVENVREDHKEVNWNEAEIIVAMGKGVGSPENIATVVDFADQLGGVVGTTRALVDLGWMDYCYQIGQTGKTVVPKLYFAIGISGSMQHIAGMSNSEYIIAINFDRDAPIFNFADIGIVADAAEFIPILMKEL